MGSIIFFLFKVSLCLMALYLPYAVLFRNTTFFTINRFYLLTSILLSFIFPIINIESPVVTQSLAATFAEPIQFTQEALVINYADVSTNRTDYLSVVLVIYFIGVAIYLIRLFLSTRNILSHLRRGKIIHLNGYKAVQTSDFEIFTFFNVIFLPEKIKSPHIINHEKVHIRQFHWIDLLIVEAASVILWFNPLMIFIRRSVKLQHEYCADKNSVLTDGDLTDYLQCLVGHYSSLNAKHFISQFNFPFIKKRINMLTKKRTPAAKRWIYLVLIPVTFFILAAFSNRKVYAVLSKTQNDSIQQTELTFITPLENETLKVTSEFGDRIHPLLKKRIKHTGVDFVSPEGEKVIAPESGVVVQSSFVEGRGNYIIIKHDDTFSTSYSHLKERTVQVGGQVKKSQVIGLVGNTGLSVGSHLHYEVLKNGDPVDPTPFLTKK